MRRKDKINEGAIIIAVIIAFALSHSFDSFLGWFMVIFVGFCFAKFIR